MEQQNLRRLLGAENSKAIETIRIRGLSMVLLSCYELADHGLDA